MWPLPHQQLLSFFIESYCGSNLAVTYLQAFDLSALQQASHGQRLEWSGAECKDSQREVSLRHISTYFTISNIAPLYSQLVEFE